jgi:DNA replication protein DnaC
LATRRAQAAFPTGKTFATWDPGVSSIATPTQTALRTLEWIGRRENLVVCGPSGTGKTFFLEALGQLAVEAGLKVAWSVSKTCVCSSVAIVPMTPSPGRCKRFSVLG